jgi:uracil-DNA glycosylase family 4
MNDRQNLLELVVALRARLEWCRDTGVEVDVVTADGGGTGRAAIVTADVAAAVSAAPRKTQVDGSAPSGAPAETLDLLVSPEVRAARDLPQLRAAIGDCTRCKLAPHRTNLVFGVGNPAAELVFVGEAPGRDEDLRGEPFIGRAGQLLTEIITKGMKLRREDVYIANIIKCRPPQNRNPEPDEIASCEPFLVRQLALIGPKAIVALGTFAAQTLLKTRTPITRLRGAWVDYHGIPLMPTFHPAYLLRNPAEKRVVWEDIQQVMHALGLPR